MVYTAQEVREAEDERLKRLKRQYQMERELSRIEDAEHAVFVPGSTRYAICIREIHAAIFLWG